MKTARLLPSGIPSFCTLVLCFSLAGTGLAQTGTTNYFDLVNVVTIRATDPYASEPCGTILSIDEGRFTVRRTLGTNVDLLVLYSIHGTARNGVDYVGRDGLPLSGSVVIPQGAWSADIVIRPLWDDLLEGCESVVLRVEPKVCVALWPPPPECYLVGQPAEAAVFIKDCQPPDLPPQVRLVEPPNGALFQAPADIHIVADTVDPDGYVPHVEFYAGTNLIGEQTIFFFVAPSDGTPVTFDMTWTQVPAGRYALTARATDDAGIVGVSPPVYIAVVPEFPPPITNRPPVVSIVATDPVAIEGTNCWGWPNLTNRWPLGSTNYWSLLPGSSLRLWWFTNCGPKSASFVVRRDGNTNSDLLVRYRIGGTAINGVDYEPLSGVVAIPAGARRAEILVVPKDDRVIEPIETVVLGLLPMPDASAWPPDYVVGTPSRAGAIIVDSNRPRPVTASLADRCFLLGADALDGAWFRIERSADLRNWSAICTNQAIQGAIHFVDPDAGGAATGFYRAVAVPEPSQN